MHLRFCLIEPKGRCRSRQAVEEDKSTLMPALDRTVDDLLYERDQVRG